MRSWQRGMHARPPAAPTGDGATDPSQPLLALLHGARAVRHGPLAKRIRWQAALSLAAIVVTSALLALEGVRLSRLDLAAIGAAVLVLAGIALLFGRDAGPATEELEVRP